MSMYLGYIITFIIASVLVFFGKALWDADRCPNCKTHLRWDGRYKFECPKCGYAEEGK